MAHELDELIPIMDRHFALCYHRILFTHIPGNHDASEAYPLVDAPRKKERIGKKGKLVARKKKRKRKRKEEPPRSRS